MDGKLEGTRSPKLEPIPRHLSTFEMSVNLEFQAGTPQKGAAIPKLEIPICSPIRKFDYASLPI